MDVGRYWVAVIAFGIGSSSSDQSAFGFLPVQAAQVSVETLAIPPNLGVAGLNGFVVVALPVEPVVPDVALGGFGPVDPLAPDAALAVADAPAPAAPDAALCEG